MLYFGKHANTIELWNVASTATVTARHAIAAKPRNVTTDTTVTLPPTISSSSASSDVKVINDLDVDITNDLYIGAVDSPPIEQTPSEPPTYNLAPVEQQDTLHDFSRYVNQGTFSIPCRGKIYCPLPGMDPVAWPREKSARLPRTLAQLARQDFKKEPPDNFAIMLSPQYPIIPYFL